MRIIAGTYRGRKLASPEGKDIRPTTGRMRERVFSILQNHQYPALAGAKVADLFAGTGALGLEALSRGAEHVTFVEKSPSSLTCLKENIATLKADGAVKTLRSRATQLPKVDTAFSHIFMDPPYGHDLIRPTLDALIAQCWVNSDSVIICEMHISDGLDLPPSIDLVDDRSQGIQRVVLLRLKPDS